MIDRTLGHFRVLEQIGAGGMGVVYRARDEHLRRDVAIKVLPPGGLSDDDARRRFRTEALALSRLNHPHIATVFDFDTEDGLDYLVTEYIPGLMLQDKLKTGALSEQEVVRLGVQLADGLSAAHRNGVVHRDLKPGNLRLTPDGHLKILDFGLATLLRSADEEAAAETEPAAAAAGGTMPYMAPEQLSGQPADARSDIWAAGVTLYEMATGRHPFQAKTGGLTAAAILQARPVPPRQVTSALSSRLEDIILKCLEREPENRFQTAKELLVDLRRARESSGPAPTPVISRRRSALMWGGGVLVIAAAVGIAGTLMLRRPALAPASEYEQLTNFNGSVRAPALSRDGRLLAFVVEGPEGEDSQVYVKLLPKGDPVRLTRDTLTKQTPAFSPDGSRIAYRAGDDLWLVPALGGEPQILLRHAQTLHWVDDQRVVFSSFKNGIHLALVTGTEDGAHLRDVYLPPTEVGMVHASWPSPDGKWVLMTEMDATGEMPCSVVPLDGPRSAGVQVGPAGAPCGGGAWSPDSRWIYVSAGTSSGYHLWRQRFPDGSPEQMTFGATSETDVAVAPDGSVIAAIGAVQTTIRLHDGGSERRLIAEAYVASPSFTPDGKALLYLVRSPASRTWQSGELWRVDIESGVRMRLLPGVLTSHYSLSRDGKGIVFTALDARGVSGIWLAPVERNSAPRQLTSSGEYRPFFGAQGDIIYLGSEGAAKFLFRMRDDGSEREKIRPDPILYLTNVSPDGEWAAVWVPGADEKKRNAVVAVPIRGGTPMLVCRDCGAGWTGTIQGAPPVSWTLDQKYLFLSQQFSGMGTKTFAVLLSRGRAFPDFPATGIGSERDVLLLPGVRTISEGNVFPGPSPAVYAFFRSSSHSNLYRIRLPPPE